jgi:hypothetical protein
VIRRAIVILALLAGCSGMAGAQGMKLRLFDWLTGNDAEFHRLLRDFFKLDPGRFPTLEREPDGTMRLENHGGAPSAIAWAPLEATQSGLYTLRFEARWNGEGEHGRASVGMGPARLDFEPGRSWREEAVSTHLQAPSGPSSLSFSLHGRQGTLEIRKVEIIRMPFDVRVTAGDADLALELLGKMPADVTLQWSCGGQSGQLALEGAAWTHSGPVSRAVLPRPAGSVYQWTLTREGRVIVVGERVRLSSEKVHRGAAAVTVRRDGTMLVDGRPFLPLGLYLHDNTVESVEKAVESGVNFVIVNDGESAKAAVEAARAHQMQAMVETPIAAGSTTEIRAALQQVMDRYRDLPVFGWTAVDEPDLKAAYTPAVMSSIRQELLALDGRPLYQANHSPRSFWSAGTECDILAVDPYPLGAVPRPLTTVGDWVDEARAAVGPGRSVWLVAQAFVEAPFWPRPPTPEQLRAMTWIALNHGARGVVYYTVHEILDPDSVDHKWDLRRTPLWAEIAKETAELGEVRDFLLHEGGPTRLASRPPFDSGVWDDGRGNVLIAIVNTSDAEAEAFMSLPPEVHDVQVSASAPPLEGKVALRVPAYGVLLMRGRLQRTAQGR